MNRWMVIAIAALGAACAVPGAAHAAGGVDLTATACPATGTHTRTIDCASGTMERIEGTLTMPADMPDLVGLEAQLTFDFGSFPVPTFWDFQGQGASVLAVSTGRGPGCTAYTNTYGGSSAFGFASASTASDSVTVLLQCGRNSPLAVVAGQKLFGFTLTLDTSNSSESGLGSLSGCSAPLAVYVDWVRLDGQGGTSQVFSGPDSVAGAGDAVAFNGGAAPHAISVSVQSVGVGGTVSSNLYPPDIESSLRTYHVADGKGRKFTFTPAPAGFVTNVLVDGVSVGTPSQYTFTNVHADHVLTVVFGGPAPTTTTVTTNPNPSTFGQAVTLTATIAPGDATGSVSFRDSLSGPPSALGSAPVVAGQASLVLNGLAAGIHHFTATYAGDALHQASSTAGAYTHQVQLAATTTALSSSLNPSVVGQDVPLTATVTPVPTDGTLVSFLEGSNPFATAALTAGVAHATLFAPTPGDHSLHASFPGDSQHTSSASATLVQRVLNLASLSLASNLSIAVTGQPVSLTATLGTSAPGSVDFFDSGIPLGNAPVSLPSGKAVLATSAIQAGRRVLTAAYVPCCGSAYAAGTSPGFIQLVVQPPVINSIVDVPHDQGGWVRLTMAACSLDNAGESSLPIASYGLWRHVPTALSLVSPPAALARVQAVSSVVTSASLAPAAVSASSFPPGTWELVTNGPGLQLPQYVIALPTISNAVPDTFVVTASTTTPATWFISNVASGQSQDNLAPAAPVAFGGTFAAGAHLAWGANTEPDLAGYRLYRGATVDFSPAPENLVAAVTSTTYDDVAPGAGGYYKLSAVDVNGNESPYATALVGGTTAVGDAPVAVLALTGAWPNPAVSGRMDVRFALSRATRATLALFDLGGRQVAAREVGALGAGWHVVNLAEGRRLSAGLYFLRLEQGGETRTTSVVVMD